MSALPSYAVQFSLPKQTNEQIPRWLTFLVHGDDGLDAFTRVLRDNGIRTYSVDEYDPNKHNSSLLIR